MKKNRIKSADAEAISFHYDLSNDFYELLLCENMLYTCAYYRSPQNKLAVAQKDKMDLVCRKLRINSDDSFLDIGCGWGSLVIWASKHYGVNATGVTLSKEQAKWANEWIQKEGLSDRCKVLHLDYRDFPSEKKFSKISAIGIIEHVGIANYPSFFRGIRERLEDEGLFLNHGITCQKFRIETSQNDFLQKNVFPNGELENITNMMNVMEQERWEILDVENLRLHYAKTCQEWFDNLEEHSEKIRDIIGERNYRIYKLWLACSSTAFYRGGLGLYQVLLQKFSIQESRYDDPSTREEIYIN
ncbi:MAG: cyclopropane-fatty-acyl-phospholipid synthase family protein [Nitrospinota bacterium]|nr:cyclopropane-fatty-acyl-phospholipid synthase family protein [Nitrospinota bacterium]